MEKNTLYAKFNYNEQDKELVNVLEEYLNIKADDIFNFFDSSLLRKPVEINIIPTKKEYDEINKKRRKVNEIPNWEIGIYYDNKIEYLSLNDYKNTRHAFKLDDYDKNLEIYKKTIIHEYVHYVTDLYLEKHKVSNTLKYLKEGIAQYLSGQKENIILKFDSSLDDILNSKDCYIGWYLLTKYIIDSYGKDYFLTLLKDKEKALFETKRLYEEAKKFYID